MTGFMVDLARGDEKVEVLAVGQTKSLRQKTIFENLQTKFRRKREEIR